MLFISADPAGARLPQARHRQLVAPTPEADTGRLVAPAPSRFSRTTGRDNPARITGRPATERFMTISVDRVEG